MNTGKNKFAAAADAVFLRLIIFGLCFVWARLYAALFVSLIAAFTVTLGVSFLIDYRAGKKSLTKEEKKRVSEVADQFVFGGESFCLDFFSAAFKTRYAESTQEGEFIRVGKSLVRPAFSPKALDSAFIARVWTAARESKAEKLMLLTACGADKDAAEVALSLPSPAVRILAADEVHALCGFLKSYPEITFVPKKGSKRRALKQFAAAALSRNHFGKYLGAALLLLFGAYVLSYPIYYVIAASVCLALSALCLTNVCGKLLKEKTSAAEEKIKSSG